MKSKIFMGIFLIFILIANVSFASYSTVTMSVVEEPICTIELGENSKFEKKLISKDLANKEVTIQLQVINDEKSELSNAEIVLVIDNSNSMQESTSSGELRSNVIKSSAKTFVTNLLKNSSDLKVGAVSFSTSSEKNAEGFITVGTTNDATKLSDLTNDATTLTNAIDGISYAGQGIPSYTNLEAGLELGNSLFSSEENNKYLLVLTDGLPNVVLNQNAAKYDDSIINATKAKYSSITASGVKVITMLTGIKEGEASVNDTFTYNQYIEQIWGTPTNPLNGEFYYIADDNIEKTITEDIYNSLVSKQKVLKDITVVDYFPTEIIQNFDFAYVSEANIGTISPTVDTTNNSITWTIPELANGQTATVQYKLKLKENFDSAIVNKILNTNEKVDIDYTDFNDTKQTKTSDISPKLKLVEPPAVLPKAGTITLISFTVLAGGLLVFSIIKLANIHHKMN